MVRETSWFIAGSQAVNSWSGVSCTATYASASRNRQIGEAGSASRRLLVTGFVQVGLADQIFALHVSAKTGIDPFGHRPIALTMKMKILEMRRFRMRLNIKMAQ